MALRYRLNELALTISPESNVQPQFLDACSKMEPHANGVNGNGKHLLPPDVLKQLSHMNPEGCLRPHDEVALVCGMPFDKVEDTEARALRKLMGYSRKP